MQIQTIPTAKLNPAAYNPRQTLKPGDKEFEKLRRSIEEFGFVEPIIWNEQTGNVVGGHQRLNVLLDMGHTEADCVVVDLDPMRERALNIALNKIQGDWDESKLASLMAELDASAFDVALTGFDAAEIDALMNKFYSAEAVQDSFDAEAEKAAVESAGGATAQPGDLWQLGDHRLLCGDPTTDEAYDRLLDGQRAQCAVVAPPIDQAEYAKHGLEPWLVMVTAMIGRLCKRADVVCWHMADLFKTGTQFMEPLGFLGMKLFGDAGLRPLWMRVWRKQGFVPSAPTQANSTKPAPQYDHLAAFAGNDTDAYNDQEYEWVSAFAAHAYQFTRRLTRDERKKWGYAAIWDIAALRGGDGVPVELPWRFMRMHSDPGQIVLDPCAGVGTSIIAAEQSGRRCFAIERDPRLCELAVRRWEQFTGQRAELIGKGS